MSIRPSATVIILRDSPQGQGFEVLLLRRSEQLTFAPGCWVFPGGMLDPADYREDEDDLLAATRQAAARETREECGLGVDPEQLLWHSHWVTPPNRGRRYATWYTLAAVDNSEQVVVDGGEINNYLWLSPQAAVEQQRAGQLKMLPPTYVSLMEMGAHNSLAAYFEQVRNREPLRYNPKMLEPNDELGFERAMCILYDDDVAYETGDAAAQGPQHRLIVKNFSYDYINTL